MVCWGGGVVNVLENTRFLKGRSRNDVWTCTICDKLQILSFTSNFLLCNFGEDLKIHLMMAKRLPLSSPPASTNG